MFVINSNDQGFSIEVVKVKNYPESALAEDFMRFMEILRFVCQECWVVIILSHLVFSWTILHLLQVKCCGSSFFNENIALSLDTKFLIRPIISSEIIYSKMKFIYFLISIAFNMISRFLLWFLRLFCRSKSDFETQRHSVSRKIDSTSRC